MNHCERDGLYSRISQQFYGIKNIYVKSLFHTELCQLKKARKTLVVKPIASSSYFNNCTGGKSAKTNGCLIIRTISPTL